MTVTAAAESTASRHERRDLALLAAGMLVSVAGDAAAMIALLLELHTHGAGWISALLAAELIPYPVFASLSGRLVDRVDNRRLLVTALVAQAAVTIPLSQVHSPWAVVALVFVLTTASTAVRPAVSAMVPVLASEERAASGYAWIATGTGIGWIAGPALGGLLTAAYGTSAALLADGATFLLIALACSLLSTTRRRAVPSETDARARGGFSLVWQDTVLRWSVLVTAVTVACAVVDNVAAPFRFLDQLHSSSAEYGGYLALWGLGALAGSQLPRRLRAGAMPTALAVGNALSGVGVLGIGLAPGLAVAYVSSFGGGIGNGIANVSLSALTVSRVEDRQRGRAFAAVSAVIQTGTGVGTIAGAPLVAGLHAGHAMVAAGALAAAIAGVTAIWTARAARRCQSSPHSRAGQTGIRRAASPSPR